MTITVIRAKPHGSHLSQSAVHGVQMGTIIPCTKLMIPQILFNLNSVMNLSQHYIINNIVIPMACTSEDMDSARFAMDSNYFVLLLNLCC